MGHVVDTSLHVENSGTALHEHNVIHIPRHDDMKPQELSEMDNDLAMQHYRHMVLQGSNQPNINNTMNNINDLVNMHNVHGSQILCSPLIVPGGPSSGSLSHYSHSSMPMMISGSSSVRAGNKRQSLGLPDEVPYNKRNKTTNRRALEWFYNLVEDPARNCVSWKTPQGHILINDVNELVKEFKEFRKKDNYTLTNILHNFLRPYNFQEISGEKKIKNGNVYISLDLESDSPGMELSVFRPGNRDKLQKILHRGTGLPQRRFFKDESQQQVGGMFSSFQPLSMNVQPMQFIPITFNAIMQANLGPDDKQDLDKTLLQAFHWWYEQKLGSNAATHNNSRNVKPKIESEQMKKMTQL
eukprot:TRINITY_DN3121_c0_g3_i1.p1 TRINITY_DN3121_c0_g3~~TRINITY_DN3121_c0_g3_i1.p1  ORF type:complete len:386 (-),score=64.55 TRINITY_DN3121_c0_g3_i1:13-1077(-)